MKREILCIAASAGFAAIVGASDWQSEKDACHERDLLIMQLALKANECSNVIERTNLESDQIARDRHKLFELLKTINVPEYKMVTNMVHCGDGAIATVVTKKPFTQETRVRRLIATMRHPVVADLYEKYCGASCSELLNDFIDEWKMASESFTETKKMLNENSEAYKVTTQEIDNDAKTKYNEEMVSFERDISALREKIALLEGERRNVMEEWRGNAISPRVAEINVLIKDLIREIKDIEQERKTVMRIYKNNRFAISYATAGNQKLDNNSKVLAHADLRDLHHSIYVTYSNKLKADIVNAMSAKTLACKALVKEKMEEFGKLNFLLTHQDLIRRDMAEIILKTQVRDAISSVFGLDVGGSKER